MTTFATAWGAGTTARDIPELPDRGRMYRECGARLRASMRDRGVDALVLLGNGNVVYATGASWPLLDAGLSHVERPVAVVLADDEHPHLYMPFREGSSFESELPDDHVHGPLYLEFDEGVEHFASILAGLIPAGSSIAVDELTGAMRRSAGRLFPAGAPTDAALVIGPAKLVKTVDQVAAIRKACRITEEAAVDVQKSLAPGVRQIDLSAAFVRRAFELGATANMLEAIWQVMPTSKAAGTWTTTGDLALPLLTTERALAKGDVLWTDVSITYEGYCSDFGRTWLVGEEPSARQQAQFDQWRAILDAVLAVLRGGTTCGDLARAAIAANGGAKPWLPHFYLGHGIGTNAAETPLIGTDLGEDFDDNFVIPAGMALVLEPVVWEDGTGGYRSEEIVVVTEDGYVPITDYPYAPYGEGARA
ncbi:Xaa-Pro aminopeptidase [Mycolicibacterium chubuense NBB4]|uniref:Xaa-Pro aminopeptidase n=1 Tax=Mycolicibacterium chubuense (strain NBB4) TaxID=710421 RepID=I4BMA2_MYCCN|nr:Xaa-Pro peptidase family protein [Mycolicibacterium chubuense]AFM18409.1 Xaa-Pro aminopeptidase [Mycolicibacterium chubuense NBB4]